MGGCRGVACTPGWGRLMDVAMLAAAQPPCLPSQDQASSRQHWQQQPPTAVGEDPEGRTGATAAAAAAAASAAAAKPACRGCQLAAQQAAPQPGRHSCARARRHPAACAAVDGAGLGPPPGEGGVAGCCKAARARQGRCQLVLRARPSACPRAHRSSRGSGCMASSGAGWRLCGGVPLRGGWSMDSAERAAWDASWATISVGQL